MKEETSEAIIIIDYDYILALKPEDQEEFIRMISKKKKENNNAN